MYYLLSKNVDARLNTCFHEFCGKCIPIGLKLIVYLIITCYAKCPICRVILKKSIRK